MWRVWWDSGAPRCEGSFVEGVPFGWWEFWYEHGPQRAAGEYRDGKQFGPWRCFNYDGSPDADTTGTYWDDVLQRR